MVSVLLNLVDVEALEEVIEAQEVLGQAGAIEPADRALLLRQIFSVGSSMGRRETLTFNRVPVPGEYLCLPMEEDVWYRVELVLHTPGRPAHVAEIWAIEQG